MGEMTRGPGWRGARGVTMGRKVADCRDLPNERGCTLAISGEEDEVVEAAAQHAASVHGHADDEALRSWLREHLEAEVHA